MNDLRSVLVSAGIQHRERAQPDQKGNLLFYCMIHGEKVGKSTPSLSVNLNSGLWHCFACGARGNLERLLAQAPVPLPHAEVERAKQLLGTAHERVALPVRGEVGFVLPALPEELLTAFSRISTAEQAAEAGMAGFDLALLRKHGVVFDRARRRTVFPIRAPGGELLGLSGRNVDPWAARRYGKYVVYTSEIREMLSAAGLYVPPSADAFKNHQWVWGMDRREPIGEPGVILSEGFKAALWWRQSGWVSYALMGCDMSDAQYSLLREESRVRRYYVCLDNDDAGRSGARKIMVGRTDLQLLRVALPDDIRQVDDIRGSREEVRERLQQLLKEATPW